MRHGTGLVLFFLLVVSGDFSIVFGQERPKIVCSQVLDGQIAGPYLQSQRDKAANRGNWKWFWTERQNLSSRMPTGPNIFYRGMLVTPDTLKKILSTGMRVQDSYHRELAVASDPAMALDYSLWEGPGSPTPKVTSDYYSIVFQVNPTGIPSEATGLGLQLKGDILPKNILRIWAYNKVTKSYDELHFK